VPEAGGNRNRPAVHRKISSGRVIGRITRTHTFINDSMNHRSTRRQRTCARDVVPQKVARAGTRSGGTVAETNWKQAALKCSSRQVGIGVSPLFWTTMRKVAFGADEARPLVGSSSVLVIVSAACVIKTLAEPCRSCPSASAVAELTAEGEVPTAVKVTVMLTLWPGVNGPTFVQVKVPAPALLEERWPIGAEICPPEAVSQRTFARGGAAAVKTGR